MPIFSILETIDFHNFEPAVACLFVLICSCAFIELFSEMFRLIVKLTTSDWKILSRQIGYEHGDSGSPVLAVFTGGSICAMIAFACPMEIIINFVGGSQLFASLLRAFYLFYSPFRPKYMHNIKSKKIHLFKNTIERSITFEFSYFITDDTSLGYSQLKPVTPALKQSASCPSVTTTSAGDVSRRILRCLSKPSIVTIPKSKSRSKKTKKDEELEREWLLLGEPASPRNTIILSDEQDTSSLTIAANPPSTGNTDHPLHAPTKPSPVSGSDSETDSSTDIDAIVDEYRQKVEVTTSGPSEKVLRIPSMESWRLAIVLITLYMVGVALSVVGFMFQSIVIFCGGILGKYFII